MNLFVFKSWLIFLCLEEIKKEILIEKEFMVYDIIIICIYIKVYMW